MPSSQTTTGKVVAAGEADRGYDVAVEWDLAERLFGIVHRPLRDWFSKDKYQEFLQEE